MTIYSLMNKVNTLRFYVILAAKSYREDKKYYDIFEGKALASLDTLLELVHIKIASKIIAKVRFPKYSASSLS